MRPTSRAQRAITLVCASAILAIPASASAAVTASQITSPADPVHRIFDDDVPDGNQLLTVSGTSNGTTGDLVDVRCVYGDSDELFADNVPVAADGTFTATATIESLASNDAACRLRAIPDGTSASDDVFAFTGPRTAVHEIDLGGTRAVSGSVTPVVNSFDVEFVGFRAAGDLESFTDGISDYGATTPSGERLDNDAWEYAAETNRTNYDDTAGSIRVDGRNVWGGDDVPLYDYDDGGPEPVSAPPGFTGAQTTATVDPVTGVLTVTETAPLFRCPDDSFPATEAKCGSAIPVGVTLVRTTTVSDEGARVAVRDEFRSTDGAAHTVKTEQYNETDDEDYPRWRFPTDADFGYFDDGDYVTGQPAPGTVQWADDTPSESPGGTLTWFEPVDYFRFSDYDYLLTNRTVAVPAGGAGAHTTVYGADRSATALATTANAVEDVAGLPVLTVTSPGNGAIVGEPTVTVAGTARDNKGIASVTVNGAAASRAGEAFSAPVALAPGGNTVTVVATDTAGNTATAVLTVTYVVPNPPTGGQGTVRRCIVPKIKAGSTQKAVKTALVKANCKAGKKVVLKTSRTVRKGRVISISRRAGQRLPAGTAIKLNVSKGKPAAKRKRR